MNARERIENLWDRATPIGPLLDAYAHELADKIRDSEQLRDPTTDSSACPACQARSNR